MQYICVQCWTKGSRSEIVDSVSQHQLQKPQAAPHDVMVPHVMQNNINKVLTGKDIECSSVPALSKASLLAPSLSGLWDLRPATNNRHFTSTGVQKGHTRGGAPGEHVSHTPKGWHSKSSAS